MRDATRGPADDSDSADDCCCTTATRNPETPIGSHWIGRDSVLEAELPDPLKTRLGRLIGNRSVDTFADWVTEIRQFTGGGSISVEDLCHAASETDHWGELDGKRYDFRCFYDAVILAALADEPVDIRTVSPEGSAITAKAIGTSDLTVSPEQAVFSFGVAANVEGPADGEPSAAEVYAAVCPYVRAFRSPAAYAGWAEEVSAATVGMPLQGATSLAAALVE
ncbi:MAG: organomercurial lyase [Halobacteriales archaeon]